MPLRWKKVGQGTGAPGAGRVTRMLRSNTRAKFHKRQWFVRSIQTHIQAIHAEYHIKQITERQWFSGKIHRCHRWAPRSIRGCRKQTLSFAFSFVTRYKSNRTTCSFYCFFPSPPFFSNSRAERHRSPNFSESFGYNPAMVLPANSSNRMGSNKNYGSAYIRHHTLPLLHDLVSTFLQGRYVGTPLPAFARSKAHHPTWAGGGSETRGLVGRDQKLAAFRQHGSESHHNRHRIL